MSKCQNLDIFWRYYFSSHSSFPRASGITFFEKKRKRKKEEVVFAIIVDWLKSPFPFNLSFKNKCYFIKIQQKKVLVYKSIRAVVTLNIISILPPFNKNVKRNWERSAKINVKKLF